MSIEVSGVARIRHADSGEIYMIEPDELDWNQVAADERQMGTEVAHGATMNHPELGLLTWTLWEYPLGMENDREVDVGVHELLENFRIQLVAEDDLQAFGDRVESLVEWFGQNFEDPANSLPYVSAEGGYQWIWGGPVAAREALDDNFPEEDPRVVSAAVEVIEAEGTLDWSPRPNPDDTDYPDDDQDLDTEEDLLAAIGPEPDFPHVSQGLVRGLANAARPTSGPVFGQDSQGRVELLGWTAGTSELNPGLLEGLRSASAKLVAALTGTNSHVDLLDDARAYLAATIDPVSIPRLYSFGVALENTAAQIAVGIDEREVPPLPRPAEASLGTLLSLHGSAILSTDEGRRLAQDAADYRRSPTEQAALTQALRELTVELQTSPVVGDQAREVVAEFGPQAGRGPHPERSNQVSSRVILGAVAALGSLALGVIQTGVGASDVGMAVAAMVTTGVNAAAQLLISNADSLLIVAAAAVQDAVWLRALIRLLDRMTAPGQVQAEGPPRGGVERS